MVECPKCGNDADNLVPIAAGMKVALEATGQQQALPPSVCTNCYEQLSSGVSRGVKLRMEAEAKEKNRVIMWKNRVNLVKQGRNLMGQKAYAEAAISYEKYIKVLEFIYEVQPGQLTPENFGATSRSKEITVITSVLWDLFRIYDSSPTFGDRMQKTGHRLTQFAKFSPIFPDIIKKAESFRRSAKNPAVVKQFLKGVKGSSGRCFVATSAFNSPVDPVVIALKYFRDDRLKSSKLGRQFIYHYYRKSPRFAQWLDKHPNLKPMTRYLLRLSAQLLTDFRLK